MNRPILVIVGLLLWGAACATETSTLQPRTEIRDPVRGVSFYSVQLSDDAVNDLQVVDGNFADSDRVAVGLSAMIMDGSTGVDEYVLWLRHEGRRWLSFSQGSPVTIEVDGAHLDMAAIRAAQPSVGADSRFFEKLEFRIDEAALDQLVNSENAVIGFRSDSGAVEKQLTAEQLESLRRFRLSLRPAIAD